MEFEVLEMATGTRALARELRGLVDAPESVAAEVSAIIDQVRREGDEALRSLTERFDTAGNPAPALRIAREELTRAEESLDGRCGPG